MTSSMHKFVILFAIISSAICQYQLGTNYQTDHSARQEVIDANGEYEGQYSYQDPTGSRVVVKYNAGRNGFNVIGEDKIPQQPQPQSYVQPQPQSYVQPQPQSYVQPQIPQSYAQPQPETYAQPQPETYAQPQPQPQSYVQPQPQSYVQPQPQIPQSRYYQPQPQQAGAEELYQQFQQRSQELYAQEPQQYYAQAQTHQPQTAAYQPQPSEEYQPKFTQAIFKPAESPFPAATAGQTKSYYEYLEEEQKEANAVSTEKSGSTARAHVSVQNSNHQGYSYNIQL